MEEKEINGWKYYRSPNDGKMIAYYESAKEQLIFETDESFYKWFKSEERESEQRV